MEIYGECKETACKADEHCAKYSDVMDENVPEISAKNEPDDKNSPDANSQDLLALAVSKAASEKTAASTPIENSQIASGGDGFSVDSYVDNSVKTASGKNAKQKNRSLANPILAEDVLGRKSKKHFAIVMFIAIPSVFLLVAVLLVIIFGFDIRMN